MSGDMNKITLCHPAAGRNDLDQRVVPGATAETPRRPFAFSGGGRRQTRRLPVRGKAALQRGAIQIPRDEDQPRAAIVVRP